MRLPCPNRYVKQKVAEAFAEINDPKAVQPLIQSLNDPNRNVKQKAIEALSKIIPVGDTKILMEVIMALLIQTLQDPNGNVGKKAREALAQIANQLLVQPIQNEQDDQNQKKVRQLEKTLEDKDPIVRQKAVEELGQIRIFPSPRSVKPLISQFLNDENENVQKKARKVLFQISGGNVALIEDLSNKDWLVRQKAVEKWGAIGGLQAIIQLNQALKDRDWRVRKKVAEVLGNVKIVSTLVVEALDQACGDIMKEVRQEAAKALEKISNSQTVEEYIQILTNKNNPLYIREQAANTLEKISTLETLAKLIQLPKVDFYDCYIFSLSRKLAIRFSKVNAPFIPVYPELIGSRNH
jgi:HEAT repeat protein